MKKYTKTIWVLVVWLMSSCHTPMHAQTTTISLKKGQVISLITSQVNPGTDTERNEYYQKVFPMAAELGFKQEGSFDIKNTKADGYQPYPVMNLFSWLNQKAQDAFEQKPEWPKLKALRPTIWRELRICRIPIDKDVTMDFRKDKIYRVVFVWLNKENPKDLDKYLKGMRSTRERLGAKYMIQLQKDIFYHTFIDAPQPPDRVWIIEWPDSKSHEDYIKSEAFQNNHQYFASGVAKFHAYEATFQ